MDEQELVRIDLQLPASALDSLARLAEQLRLLTDAVNSHPERSAQPARERAENTFFDTARFQSLQPEARSAMEQGTASAADVVSAVPVRSSVTEEVHAPESAGREIAEYRERSAQAAPPDGDISDAKTAALDIQDGHTAQTAQEAPEEDLGEIPTVRPEMEQNAPDPPTARAEPEHQMPEADAERVRMSAWDALPSPVQGDVQTGIESPLGAGMVVTAEPDVPQSRWTGITEELVIPGPAPLTAESVSLAFQRDGRRYDNGFPLY